MKRILAFLMLMIAFSVQAEIVTLPIPGAPGLSITAATGVNALPLTDIRTNPAATNVTMGDDEVRNVPLGFNFPFWGQTFTNSWMSSNGFVAFQPSLNHGCCSGVDLTTTTNSAYNYTIYGLHSDLYAHPGVGSNWYLRETNSMTYGWYNVSQCCNANGGNSFEIKINSAGVVDTRIAGALVQWNAVTSGMTGDLSRGEYFQAYHGQGLTINTTTGGVSWNTAGGFTGSDPCIINPLSSTSCSGYAAAYLTQQCTISALYNPSCPGYATAYFTQQCSADPLYNAQCPGYQTAYYNQQCSLNPLYDVNCPGYASAYLSYQCSVNPLYSTTCEGYESAYFNQQCSANALYSTTCPGYAQAYLAQQCSLNGLYSTTCPNYATAYATQQALLRVNPPTTTTTSNSSPSTSTVAAVSTTTATPTISSDGTVTTTVSTTGDATVDAVITPSSSTTSATSTTSVSPVSVTSTVSQQSNTTTTVAATIETKTETKEEKKDASSTSVSSPTTASNTSTETKPTAPTARQELQARREAAVKAKAIEDGKNLASTMGKVADMESQKQVQNVVIAAMGFTPGFDTYGKVMIQDTVAYKPYIVYANQKNVDNKRLSWGLMGPSDKLHSELVDSQYNRGN
jgi:hypothetical protein